MSENTPKDSCASEISPVVKKGSDVGNINNPELREATLWEDTLDRIKYLISDFPKAWQRWKGDLPYISNFYGCNEQGQVKIVFKVYYKDDNEWCAVSKEWEIGEANVPQEICSQLQGKEYVEITENLKSEFLKRFSSIEWLGGTARRFS